MRHMKGKRALCLLLAAALCVPMIGGCGQSTAVSGGGSITELLEDDAFSREIKAQEGYSPVAENDRLALSVNGKTADLCLTDKASGKRFYAGAPGEGLSSGSGAQIELSFANTSGQISTMNSYTDGVELGQYIFGRTQNGVRVTYDIGKRVRQYLIPTVITATRMQSAILDKLDAAAAAAVTGMYTRYSLETTASAVVRDELKKKYPMLEHDDVYVLTDGLAEFATLRLERSIAQSGYTAEDLAADKEENGVVDKDDSLSFRIPVEYTIDGDGLVCRVLTGEILCPDGAQLLTLSLLPYMGAADRTKQGFMFVPDGSGALIRLNNGRESQGAYQMPMYGDDLTIPTLDRYTQYQTLSLPVFGMAHADGGFLAVIESGAALSTLYAAVSGVNSPLNVVYPRFTMQATQKTDVPYSQAGSMYFYPGRLPSCDLVVRYIPLSGDDNSVGGMAARYRRYLLDGGQLGERQAADPAFYLGLVGAVSKKDTVFGVTVERTLSLTTFAQAGEILTTLHERGVGTVVTRFLDWANGGATHTAMNRIDPVGALGGEKGQTKLSALCAERGDRLYWDLDLQYVRRTALFDGYGAVADGPKNIMGETAVAQTFHAVSGKVTGSVNLFAPVRWPSALAAALSGMAKDLPRDVSLGGMGSVLYADYDAKKYADRDAAAGYARETFAAAAKAGRVLGVSPTDLALSALSEAVRMPTSTNGHYLFDEEVPFYEMVVHGYLSYAGEPMGEAVSMEEGTLRLIEYGAMPYFEWMYAENDVLHGVQTDYLAIGYREWLDDAVTCWQKVSAALAPVSGQIMTSHDRPADDVSRTVYEDGTVVYVNYRTEEVTVDGRTVAARDCLVVKGGESR